MPKSKIPMRAFAVICFSCSRPIAANIGLDWCDVAVGALLCATTQIEQGVDCVLGWLWVDSSTAVHNIRDRQIHANHR